MTSVVCLSLTLLSVIAGAVLYVWSFRERNGLLGLIGMSAMIVAAMPATAYAVMSG